MGAAPQVGNAKPAALENPPRDPDVAGLASVRSAHQSDLVVPQPERALAAGGEERHRLKRLRRGPQIDGQRRIATGRDDAAIFIGDGHRSAVSRFGPSAAKDAGEEGGQAASHRALLLITQPSVPSAEVAEDHAAER
jgi:hypothetical protein